MSAASDTRDRSPARSMEDDIHDFYERWVGIVYTFCRLQLGDDALAEIATTDAFVRYIRRDLPLSKHGIPVQLLRNSKLACDERSSEPVVPPQDDFQTMLLEFPEEHRAIFILHTVLGVGFGSTAAITGVSYDEVWTVWMEVLLELRDKIIPAERRSGVLATAPSPAALLKEEVTQC